MSLTKQCAKLDVQRHDLNRLLSVTYNCAVRLSEHADCDGSLLSLLCQYNVELRDISEALAKLSMALIALGEEQLEHQMAWEPVAYAEPLGATHKSEIARWNNGELLHRQPHDLKVQSE